jgi:hypothetical protein
MSESINQPNVTTAEPNTDAQQSAGVPKATSPRPRKPRRAATIQVSIRLSHFADETVNRLVETLNAHKPPDAPKWNRTSVIELALMDHYHKEFLPLVKTLNAGASLGGPENPPADKTE